MLKIFSKIKLPLKEKFSIGLDIGTHSIKCAKLKLNGGDAELMKQQADKAEDFYEVDEHKRETSLMITGKLKKGGTP